MLPVSQWIESLLSRKNCVEISEDRKSTKFGFLFGFLKRVNVWPTKIIFKLLRCFSIIYLVIKMVKVEFFFLIIPLLSLIFLAQAEISHLEVQPAQAQFLTAYREFQFFFLFLFFGFPAFSITFSSCPNKFIPWNCCSYVRAWL